MMKKTNAYIFSPDDDPEYQVFYLKSGFKDRLIKVVESAYGDLDVELVYESDVDVPTENYSDILKNQLETEFANSDIIITIAGGVGSGKSLITGMLLEAFGKCDVAVSYTKDIDNMTNVTLLQRFYDLKDKMKYIFSNKKICINQLQTRRMPDGLTKKNS